MTEPGALSKEVSLDSGASTLLEFTWNTLDVPPDNYCVTAEAVLSEDEDPDDNVARTFVGGIFNPGHKPETNMLTSLVPLATTVLIVVAFGMMAIGFFRILMSVRIKWPLQWN